MRRLVFAVIAMALLLGAMATAAAAADISEQWAASPHAKVVEDPAKRDGCVTCHAGNAFAKGITKAPEAPSPEATTCDSCHDWGNSNPSNVRKYGEVTLPNGKTFEAGKGALCISCHNSRKSTSDPKNISGQAAPHGAAQGDMLAGTNGSEFEGFKYSNSPHTTIENACVTCHMAKSPGEGDKTALVGEHTYLVKDEKGTVNLNACNTCHTKVQGFNRTAYGDFDGNRKIQGIQTEVKGLLELIKQAVEERLDGGNGGQITESHGKVVFLAKDGKTELKNVPVPLYKAAYNYLFVENDGSFGIHNPVYAVQLLQTSFKAATGQDVPNATLRY